MKVLELLDDILDICDKSTGMLNRIIVDKSDLIQTVEDIKRALPDEIQQAQFIKNERQRILDEAKNEYELLVKDAEKQADILVDQHEITMQAKQRAREILTDAETRVKQLKLDSYDYIDKILFDFQQKMDMLNEKYFGEMFTGIQNTFEDINEKLLGNRNEIKDLAYRTQVEGEL